MRPLIIENIGHVYWQKTLLWLPKLLSGLVLFGVFWWAAKIVKRLLLRASSNTAIEKRNITFLIQLIQSVLLIMGALSALEAFGVDTTTLIAGLGISGFTLGFAMKDITSNLLSGLLILIYQPFKIGMELSIGTVTGRVKTINMRCTVIATDTEDVLVPNAKILTEIVRISVEPAKQSGSQSRSKPLNQLDESNHSASNISD